MNILAVNGSARGKKGNTYKILKPLTEGMKKAGAEVQIINLSELNINFCEGCMSCIKTTPGKCILKDDMENLLKKIVKANLIIYGTPLYAYSMSGLMKNFIDRMLPLPVLIQSNKKLTSGLSLSHTITKIFLVSSCGFADISFFNPLIATYKLMAKENGMQYLGEILRTTANFDGKKKQNKFIDLLPLAGEQLIKSSKIEPELQNKLQAPWISVEEYQKLMKKIFSKKQEYS
jgi:FMN-dependent NADH-azoreductase